MKKYIALFILTIFLLVISCGTETETQTSQETNTKDEFIALLKTPVENYDVTYHKESSTAGSETKKSITLSVKNNDLYSYKQESWWCGPGNPDEPRCRNCIMMYTDGIWENCDCGDSFEWCTQININKLNQTSDAQLKEAALQYLEKSNTSNYTFLEFNGSYGRKCFFYFSSTNVVLQGGGTLYCFREDGLLVNTYGSPPHPVILEVEGYDSESVAKQWWGMKTEYLENDPVYQREREEHFRQAITTGVNGWKEEGLLEIEDDANRLYEKRDEAALSEEQKNAITEEIDSFIAEIQQQNAEYVVQLDAILTLAETDVDAAKEQYNILNEELIQYQEAMDDKRHDIRREIDDAGDNS